MHKSEDMAQPLVTAIIPAYNSELFLRDSIGSAISQTWPAIEIIVINDGSEDGTAEVANSYGDRIIYIEQTNQGQGAARNAGLRRATGEFIAFLDADDYWEPDFIKECAEFLQEHPDAVAVLTGWVKILHDGSREVVPPLISDSTERPQKAFMVDRFFEFWATQGHIQTGALVIRHSVIQTAGYQNPALRVSQDLEHWALIATYGKWGFIPRVLFASNSRINARASGWRKRYKARRKLCPDVETWEGRIQTRINEEDRPGFEIIRGQVASGYAHYNLLAGKNAEALHIVKKYGRNMPANRLTRLMRFGASLGRPGIVAVCLFVGFLDYVKDIRLRTSQ